MTANVQEISISFHYASTLAATSKALEYLQTNGDGKSGVHLSALLPIWLYFALVVCSHILYVVVPIAAMLHIISYDLTEIAY